MAEWKPIEAEEFDRLLAEQVSHLNKRAQSKYQQCRVSPWPAIIRRSEESGDERVFVVAPEGKFVLYYDDVEEWFTVGAPEVETGRLEFLGGAGEDLNQALQNFP